jgi:putative ABC transport system substrate-binding protein
VKNRRKFLIVLGAVALAAPFTCIAQQERPKAARIGVLEFGSGDAKGREALIRGLQELGYVEGKNVFIEYRVADGKYERLPALAAELVRMKVDIIVGGGTNAIQAAQHASGAIPIVMVRTGDPVGSGFVASLARPGRNITGLSNIIIDVVNKYLELLRVAVPKVSRVTIFANPSNPNHPSFLKRIQAAENTNGVKLTLIRVNTGTGVEDAFRSMTHEHAEAVIVLPDAFFLSQARRIAELAVQHHLPTMFWTREAVESGGLMSYGQNSDEHYYRAASYVDRILKGARPGDLPVEQPTKIELVINMKTARSLGLTIPQSLQLRADDLIQ